jgi:hypothetical protein
MLRILKQQKTCEFSPRRSHGGTLVLRQQAQLLLRIGSGYNLQDGVGVENIRLLTQNVDAYYPDNDLVYV